MKKLLAISPVGTNGQTVVPAAIRKVFRIKPGQNWVGFFLCPDNRIELAPIKINQKSPSVRVKALRNSAKGG